MSQSEQSNKFVAMLILGVFYLENNYKNGPFHSPIEQFRSRRQEVNSLCGGPSETLQPMACTNHKLPHCVEIQMEHSET